MTAVAVAFLPIAVVAPLAAPFVSPQPDLACRLDGCDS
jgi:hypothetical protein